MKDKHIRAPELSLARLFNKLRGIYVLLYSGLTMLKCNMEREKEKENKNKSKHLWAKRVRGPDF